MDRRRDLELVLRSRTPLVVIETRDEGRVLDMLRDIVVSRPGSPQAEAYMGLARTVRDKLGAPSAVKPFPEIVYS